MGHYILRKDIFLKDENEVIEKYRLSKKLPYSAVEGTVAVGTHLDVIPNSIVKEIKVNKRGKFVFHLEPIYFTSKNFMINEIKDYFIPKKWIVARAEI